MEEQRNTLTLYELNALVRRTLELEMSDDYWVEAELSEVHEVRGHCYMELIQKDARNNTPVAKASAKCWATVWRLVRPHFERVTGQNLHAGMKVLLKVSAQFHENYGFSWIVNDIDPTYTMGDMARKRQEIIRQLKEEGVFDLQKDLQLPMFCQRIAVISSANAAGYGDFVNQLDGNEFGFRFHAKLFPAVMQGEAVETSIISAFEKIYAEINSGLPAHSFDCVVIIRGGGATSDLSGFDTLALAENVANFPLPVITGIGHERDESVLDMVSHTRVKTPTAAAAFLISNLKSVLDEIEDCEQRIHAKVKQRMDMEKIRLQTYARQIPMLFSVVRTRQEALLGQLLVKMKSSVGYRLQNERHRMIVIENNIQPLLSRKLIAERHQLDLLSQRLMGLDPNRLLKRGYSITLKDGRTVRDVSMLKEGDEIETRFENGTICSVINQIDQKS